jgi:hypothetical protein
MEEIMRSYKQHPRLRLMLARSFVALAIALSLSSPIYAQNDSAKVAQKLQGFDAYMEKVLKDWNGPGIGVGIVVKVQV